MQLVHRVTLFLVLVVSASLSGCSSTTTGSSSDDAGSTTPPSGSAVGFKGTLTGKSESGIIDLTLPPGTKTTSVHLQGDPAPGNVVNGTINLGNGKTVTLTGTFDSVSGTVTLSGGGYTLTGKLVGGTLSGTYTGPNGAGSFALQSTVSGAVAVYCGTYTGSSAGNWNLVQGADNSLSGSFTDSTKGGSGILTGKLTGTAIDLIPQGSTDTATGTLAADGSVSGTYGPPGAAPKGNWSGRKDACAK